MPDSHSLARELDRVMRKIDAQMHRKMPKVDHARIGPMGSFLLMQLEAMQPCSIQELATAMGRDNSQLTRLLRDLEGKGVLLRKTSEHDARMTLLELTNKGADFLANAKSVLSDAVDGIVQPLSNEEKSTLIAVLRKI